MSNWRGIDDSFIDLVRVFTTVSVTECQLSGIDNSSGYQCICTLSSFCPPATSCVDDATIYNYTQNYNVVTQSHNTSLQGIQLHANNTQLLVITNIDPLIGTLHA